MASVQKHLSKKNQSHLHSKETVMYCNTITGFRNILGGGGFYQWKAILVLRSYTPHMQSIIQETVYCRVVIHLMDVLSCISRQVVYVHAQFTCDSEHMGNPFQQSRLSCPGPEPKAILFLNYLPRRWLKQAGRRSNCVH